MRVGDFGGFLRIIEILKILDVCLIIFFKLNIRAYNYFEEKCEVFKKFFLRGIESCFDCCGCYFRDDFFVFRWRLIIIYYVSSIMFGVLYTLFYFMFMEVFDIGFMIFVL